MRNAAVVLCLFTFTGCSSDEQDQVERPLATACVALPCGPTTACGTACTLDGAPRYCRSFNGGAYAWVTAVEAAVLCDSAAEQCTTTFACGGQSGLCTDFGNPVVESRWGFGSECGCRTVRCDATTPCGATCALDGPTRWCRSFNNGAYQWVSVPEATLYCDEPAEECTTTFACAELAGVCKDFDGPVPEARWAVGTCPTSEHGTVDPTLLPVATTSHVPLPAAYDALGVRSLPAGGSYADPTTGVRIHRLTSASFPGGGRSWTHGYSEGGDEISLPYAGATRAIHVYSGDGSHRLIDFTPGVGVGNERPLTGATAVFSDLGLTFSNNPATPYYVYISSGSVIRRFDLRSMAEAPGGGWPVTGETQALWLHQAQDDSFFVWMRGSTGSTVVGYEPATGTKKTYTNANLNEPRIDRAGRYVGIAMNTPQNGIVVWDWLTNTVAWTTSGTIPFAHNASLRRRWLTVDWNMHYPPDFAIFKSDVPGSAGHFAGPANGSLVYGNGNWIQPAAGLDDQWALFQTYAALRPPESYWLAPGGLVLLTVNGQRRLLGHPYNTSTSYSYYSFAKLSPDGRYVLFTSNMNGSPRSDLFLAEVPVR